MGVTGWLRPVFIIVNLFFWVIGLFLVGYISWTMATNSELIDGFVGGTRYFAYTILTVGILITLIGLVGCIGGLKEGSCVLKTYIAFVVVILVIEIAGGLTAYFLRDQLEVYRFATWSDFNTDTKYFIQKELQCCGYNNATEYGTNVTALPDSCFPENADKTEANLYTTACLTAILVWLDNNTAVWAGTIAGLGALQVLCLVFAACIVHKIRTARKVSSGSDQGWIDEYPSDRMAEKHYQRHRGYNKSSF